MKTMKKLVAALLVLTMVLALTGTAMAGCKIKARDYVKFTKNSYAYDAARASKKVKDPEVIVRKGSFAKVLAVKGDYAFVQLSYGTEAKIGNYVDEDGYHFWAYWFKTSTLALTEKDYHKVIAVTYSNGGNGKSKCYVDEDGKIIAFKDEGVKLELGGTRLSDDCKKHVKATAKVWMHYTPSLSQSYGKALRKDDKVAYRRIWSFDTRGQIFLGIKYKGKCLWVSKAYTKIVK